MADSFDPFADLNPTLAQSGTPNMPAGGAKSEATVPKLPPPVGGSSPLAVLGKGLAASSEATGDQLSFGAGGDSRLAAVKQEQQQQPTPPPPAVPTDVPAGATHDASGAFMNDAAWAAFPRLATETAPVVAAAQAAAVAAETATSTLTPSVPVAPGAQTAPLAPPDRVSLPSPLVVVPNLPQTASHAPRPTSAPVSTPPASTKPPPPPLAAAVPCITNTACVSSQAAAPTPHGGSLPDSASQSGAAGASVAGGSGTTSSKVASPIVLEWQQRVQEQRRAASKQGTLRSETRAAVEELQKRIADLGIEREYLMNGGASAARREGLEAKLTALQQGEAALKDSLGQSTVRLQTAQKSQHDASQRADESTSELRAQEEHRSQVEAAAEAVEEAALATEKCLSNRVQVSDVQTCEAQAREHRGALRSADREARQLRVALAEALSSGADLPNALRELEILRESSQMAAQRVEALEQLNLQLQTKIAQLTSQVGRLKNGTVDLRSEEELMREIMFQQSDSLVRRVEDLTDESAIAAADKKQLLTTAGDLLFEVDSAEARLSRRAAMQVQCEQLVTSRETVVAEVERLRRTNGALCQQALGDEADGPLSGALRDVASLVRIEAGEALTEEIRRLIHGEKLLTTQESTVRADTSALVLRLQQLLAEREEAFWVERQRLSDQVMHLERTRTGRTSNLLQQYNATIQGNSSSGSFKGGVAGTVGAAAAPAAKAAATAVSDGFRKLRDTIRG